MTIQVHGLLARLCRPMRWRETLWITGTYVLVSFWIASHSGRLRLGWGVDEGQRIAEGYFWRLLRAGDFANPDWFRDISIRSHPPVSKYLFGAAADAAGDPPRDLALVHAYDRGLPTTHVPPPFSDEYLPMRPAARMAALICNLSTAMILLAVGLRLSGILPAVLGQLMLFRHYLFGSALFVARSDAIQTVATCAGILPLLWWSSRPELKRTIAGGMLAGLFAALAFQTRLNGGVALLMSFAFLLTTQSVRRAIKAQFALVMTAAFVFASIGMNPYYWATPDPAAGMPVVYATRNLLPVRVVQRVDLQVADLRQLLGGIEPEWRINTLAERTYFAGSVFFSGKAGLILFAGLLWGAIAFAAGKLIGAEASLMAWALTSGLTMTVWIPLRWDFYFLMTLAPLVLASVTGWGVVSRELLRRFHGTGP